MSDITLVETSLRDGNQSLWGATGLDTSHMLQIGPVMDRAGFHAIDFTASTHIGVAVRYKQEDPWERMRLMRELTPNTPLQFLTTGMRFISWEVANDEFMELVYRTLVNNGIRRFCVMDPMNDAEAMVRGAELARKAGVEEIVAAVCFTVSPIHDDENFAAVCRTIAESGKYDRVYLKDPGGLVSADRATTLFPAMKAELGDLPFEFHSHCTIGLAPFSYLESVERGVECLHVAGSSAANGTGQPGHHERGPQPPRPRPRRRRR